MFLSVIQRDRNALLSGRRKCYRKKTVEEGRNLQNIYSSMFTFESVGGMRQDSLTTHDKTKNQKVKYAEFV